MSEGVLLYAVNKDTGYVYPVNVDADGKIKLAPSSTLLGVVDGHIMGYDGSTWRNILVDTTGKIILGPGSSNIGDVDVLTLPSIPSGTNRIGSVGMEGYVNAAWHKIGFPISMSGTFQWSASNTALAAGANNLDSTAASANRIYYITNISMRYNGTITNVTLEILLMLSGGTSGYQIFGENPVVNNKWYDRQGFWPLVASDFVRLTIAGATAGDDAYLRVTGFWVDISL